MESASEAAVAVKQFSVAMAICDYIPVVLFLVAALILQRDLYNKMRRRAYALFSTGVTDVFLAGALKATYKLLYAMGICDFEALNSLFFPLQSIGFLLAGAGMLLMLIRPKKKAMAVAAAPAVYSGTFLFVGLMVSGLAAIDGTLIVLSRKLKKKHAWICFTVSFVMSMCMGYLASRDFDKAIFNWLAEIVNVAGQAALLWGVILLHRAGLKDLSLGKNAPPPPPPAPREKKPFFGKKKPGAPAPADVAPDTPAPAPADSAPDMPPPAPEEAAPAGPACPHCGAALTPGAKFCDECGKPVE